MTLIACSNSCPSWADGGIAPRSPGGLAPMLVDLLGRHGGHWLFAAPPDATTDPPVDPDVRLHPIEIDEHLRRQHYDTISIDVLLRLLHYVYDTSVEPVFDATTVAAWSGYETVNRLFAERLADLIARDGTAQRVLVNDPHLMLVPRFLADVAGPRRAARLTCFLGTPWCEPDYFGLLPEPYRTAILDSLLECDVVGFHTRRWVSAFAACCARHLPDATVSGDLVHRRGRTTRLVAAPFPVDTTVLDRMAEDARAREWRDRLTAAADGRRIMVRADRLDLWKNLPRGFAAYESLLERRPDLRDRWWFAAIVTAPSRASERHRSYAELTERAVARIDARFGGDRPAVSLVRPDLATSRYAVVAALGLARVAAVTSTFDGLNLFAKEAAHLLRDGGSLLLSRNAGATELLGDVSVPLDPFDVSSMSDAMEAAMDGTTGCARAFRRRPLAGETTARWLREVFPPPAGHHHRRVG